MLPNAQDKPAGKMQQADEVSIALLTAGEPEKSAEDAVEKEGGQDEEFDSAADWEDDAEVAAASDGKYSGEAEERAILERPRVDREMGVEAPGGDHPAGGHQSMSRTCPPLVPPPTAEEQVHQKLPTTAGAQPATEVVALKGGEERQDSTQTEKNSTGGAVEAGTSDETVLGSAAARAWPTSSASRSFAGQAGGPDGVLLWGWPRAINKDDEENTSASRTKKTYRAPALDFMDWVLGSKDAKSEKTSTK